MMVVVKGEKSGQIMISFEGKLTACTDQLCVEYKRKKGAKTDFSVGILSNCQNRVTIFLHGERLQEKLNWRER